MPHDLNSNPSIPTCPPPKTQPGGGAEGAQVPP